MLATIISIVVKYWVEFFLTGAVGLFGLWIKRYVKLEKERRKQELDTYYKTMIEKVVEQNKTNTDSLFEKYAEVQKDLDNKYINITNKIKEEILAERAESRADDDKLQQQIDSISAQVSCLKAGLLSIQGKEFRQSCRNLLNDGHNITLDEWEEIDTDHTAYNGLGGNHRGDQLFELVRKKAEKNLIDDLKEM